MALPESAKSTSGVVELASAPRIASQNSACHRSIRGRRCTNAQMRLKRTRYDTQDGLEFLIKHLLYYIGRLCYKTALVLKGPIYAPALVGAHHREN